MSRTRLVRIVVSLLGVALVAAACGGDKSGSGNAGGGSAKALTIVNASGALWTCNFNPYAPSSGQTGGVIWEPLVYVNSLTGKEQPWLATSYDWSADGKQLTFTTREGVTWTDGKPFSAKDVAFTFNAGKTNDALDTYALWSEGVLDSVGASGNTKVTFTFKRVSTSSFYYVAGKTNILPEHIWSKVEDPVKAMMKKPVGTGPYTIGSCSPQVATYTKNPEYWQKGKPLVDKILYPAFVDNQPANLHLSQGKGDWGGQFVPNIDNYWVAKDKANRKYWYPPNGNVIIAINSTKPLLGDKRVRQALSSAVDREKVSKDGMYGYQPPANQAGIAVPTFQEWYDDAAAAAYDYTFDPAKVAEKLGDAGFTKGPDGMFQTPDGKPFKLSIINNGGFTDWVASVQVIVSSFKKAGITLEALNLNGNEYNRRLSQGQFDLAYTSGANGPTPYYELRDVLYGAYAEPIGKDTSRNYERWKDPKTDELIEKYDTLLEQNDQKAVIKDLQRIMLEEVPVIPVTQNVAWSQTDTSRFTNWPTAEDPYANPAPYVQPDWAVVLLNLKPKK
ncbi:ABC transporter substrate-binding protein [Actinopolymorpha alba]|uniref:ABC transporter substrate-binding protein n=1 Tax=Actinopolymorpha alba TaxID=533267 RepID=UPI00037A19EB|nr:ABC transporter substrate-binding protein [Actinopolymorpha alba]